MCKPPRSGQHYTGQFQFGTYVPAASVAEFAQTLDEAIAWCKQLQVEHVFLEVYRGGFMASTRDLSTARDALLAAGIGVSGGLTTTWGQACGTPAVPITGRLCPSSDATRQHLEHCVRLAAGLFDELILDDFYFTDCRCGRCVAGRGDTSWAAFRMEQFIAISKRLLAATHNTNPSCRLIIKYPQWYDRLNVRGYDPARETELFDAIWVGTETRNPRPGRGYNYLKESQSWVIYNWLRDIGQTKTLGGWFDAYGCDEASYIEQCYQNVLVGAPEIVLFCYPSLRTSETQPLTASLHREIPRLRRWSAALAGASPAGIACYQPANTAPVLDAYLLDYVVMIGLPAVPCAHFPTEARQLLCSEAALSDPDISRKLKDFVWRGGHVVATATFVRGLPRELATQIFGLTPVSPDSAMRATTSIRWAGQSTALTQPMVLTANLQLAGAEVLATAGEDADGVPWLTHHTFGKGDAIMLDVCTGWMDPEAMNIKCEPPLLFLPPELLSRLRELLLSRLDITVQAPASVGLYCFPPGVLAICNYRDEPCEVEIRLRGNATFASLEDMAPQMGDSVTVVEHSVSHIRLSLPARQGTLLRRQSM